MPAGRPPKPTALKMLHGNPGRRPLNDKEPKPARGERPPAAPSWLDTAARNVWRRLAPELHRLGLLTGLDRDLLALYCVELADYIRALKELRRLPAVVVNGGGRTTTRKRNGDVEEKTTRGQLVPNPWLAVRNHALKNLTRLGSELGLSPAARTRIRVEIEKGDGEDEFTRFLKRKRGGGAA